MKKKWTMRSVALFLICIFMIPTTVFVSATSTGEKIQSVENEKKQTENQLDKTNEDLKNLNSDRVSLQTYLDELNSELDEMNLKLMEIEEIRKTKENAIEEAQEQIAQAKQLQEERYEDMQKRIKFMYESGSESYLQLFLTSGSFADFLNKADYIEMLNRYDREMLDQYIRTQDEIAKKEKELQQEKETLLVLEEETAQSSEEMYASLQKAGENMKKYMAEIADKEAKALEYERQIAEQEGDLVALRAKYKEELALSTQAQAMTSRDLSDIVFASGDEDLMAAIIECEAGGESYTGKVAVGAVVMNRVRSPLFPNTVLEVIMAPRQFSPVGSGRFAIVLARGANESCYQAARDAMAGASPVGNCLFFRTPIPGLTGQQIGGHIFY